MKAMVIAALACGLSAIGLPASAQMFNNLAGDMAINRLVLAPVTSLGARSAAQRAHAAGGARGAGASRAAPLAGASTAYRTDTAATERGRRQFAARIRALSGPQAGDQVSRLLATHDLVQVWAQQAAPDGLRPGDVADAMAEYFVANWQIAHGAPDPRPPAIQAVRDEVRSALLRQPKFAALSDAQKQEMAEAFMYDTLFQGEAYLRALKRGDQEGVRSLQAASVTRFRNEVGVDLRRLNLTDRGFVQAS